MSTKNVAITRFASDRSYTASVSVSFSQLGGTFL